MSNYLLALPKQVGKFLSEFNHRVYSLFQRNPTIKDNPSLKFDPPIEVQNNQCQACTDENIDLSFPGERSIAQAEGSKPETTEDIFAKIFHFNPESVQINRLSDDKFLEINQGFTNLTGYTREDVIGRTSSEINIWESPEERNRFLNEMQITGNVSNFEATFRMKDNRLRAGQISAGIIEVNGEKCILAVTREISDHARSLISLRESEEKFRFIAERSTDIISLLDVEGAYIYVSPACKPLLGYKPEEMVGRNLLDYIHPEDKTLVGYVLKQLDIIDEIQPLHYRVKTIDGNYLWMEATALVIRDASSGNPIQIQTNARNITERVKAEEALRDSEEKLRSVISQSQDGILIIDEEGRIIEWSRGQEKISGIPRHQVMGEFIWDIHQRMAPESERTPENLEINKKQTFDLLSKGIVMQGNLIQDATIVDTKGMVHLTQTLTFPIYTPRGYMAGSVSRDVTEMKKAEDALRESESLYRTLARNFPNGAVMLFDKDLRYRVADGMGLSSLNLDREQLENHTIFEVYTPETNTILEPYYRAVLKGRTEVFEVPIGDLTYEVYAVPIKNETGDILYGMVMTQDISERKVAVQTLKSRAQYLAILNEVTQSALTETDLETMMQKIVDLLAMMFTADHCYITGWNDEMKQPIPLASFGFLRSRYTKTQLKPGEMTLTRAVLESGTPIVVDDLLHSEYISPRLANQFPSKSMLALPLIGGGLNLGAILIGFADQHPFTKDEIQRAEQVAAQIALSMYKVKLFEEVQINNIQLEKRVEDRTKDLALKNQELETFTYSVSHDLKAPLRGIDGYSRLLLEEHSSQIDEEGLSFLRTIRTAAGQMNQLIEDLLSYSRLERRTMMNNQVDIHTVVSNLILERKDDIRRNKINVVQEIPSRKIAIDEKALEQALRNLLDNAIKFSSNNIMPKINVTMIKGDEEKSILCVEDNGIGFEMKYSEKIFDIFQRLHLPEEYPGTGIGLALVKKAMQRMGGRAWAESQPGMGAKFYLEIPG